MKILKSHGPEWPRWLVQLLNLYIFDNNFIENLVKENFNFKIEMHFTRRVLSRAALSNGPMQAPQGMHGAGRKTVSRVALQGYGLGLIAWGLWYKLRDPLDFDKLRVSFMKFIIITK